jgi:hypothetical protein
MKYDTIELEVVMVDSPGYSGSVVDYGLKINGVEFHPEHPLDLTSLVKSCQWSGELDIFTCGCGQPGCAGIFQGIEVGHSHKEITWKCPDPLSVNEDTPDLWEHGVTTFEHFVFEPEQYMDAIDSGIKQIKSLAISAPIRVSSKFMVSNSNRYWHWKHDRFLRIRWSLIGEFWLVKWWLMRTMALSLLAGLDTKWKTSILKPN